ncbi:MAG: helix-turn-helix domain-containing protein [Alphaproteobacteria bacterium]|nr:helix-turn-helix domain-containing protein [Alphaproteobacteria bacterium]
MEKIHITLIGKDDVLAAILAEQGAAKPGFQFSIAPDSASADPASDVFLLCDNAAPSDGGPLCIPITKPIKLAPLLDSAISGAQLRRLKQPRNLDEHCIFKPFARIIDNVATGRSVSLTEKEACFLCAILDTGTTGLQRKDAMTQLWGYHPDADSHAVDTTLYRLRQKLQEVGGLDPCLINDASVYKWVK